MKALNYNPEDPDKMQLPAGKTCGDCAHIRRCKLFLAIPKSINIATGRHRARFSVSHQSKKAVLHEQSLSR